MSSKSIKKVPTQLRTVGEHARAIRAMHAMAAIEEALYPNGNKDHEWSGDTFEEVARIVAIYKGEKV